MKPLLFAVTFALALGSTGSLAQRIENRQNRQEARTNRGIESGQLTEKEAARLQARQTNLDRKIEKDRADGRGLTGVERARIERRQDNISRSIARQKHNGRTARR